MKKRTVSLWLCLLMLVQFVPTVDRGDNPHLPSQDQQILDLAEGETATLQILLGGFLAIAAYNK